MSEHLRLDAGDGDGGAEQIHFGGLRLAEAEDGEFHGGAGFAVEEHVGVGQRHVARGNTIDGFNDVAGGEPGFVGRGAGDGVDDADFVAVLAAEQEADAGLGVGEGLLILLVLVGVEVAGEGVDADQQAVDGAEGDILHVGFFDVVGFDLGEDFSEDVEVAVRVRAGLGGGLAENGADEKKGDQNGRHGHDGILETFGHTVEPPPGH